jgi:hypothetical protein
MTAFAAFFRSLFSPATAALKGGAMALELIQEFGRAQGARRYSTLMYYGLKVLWLAGFGGRGRGATQDTKRPVRARHGVPLKIATVRDRRYN